MKECACWRNQNNRPRGESAPKTIETLQAAWGRDQELIFEMKDEISRLKDKNNQLLSKIK